jgi:hypothetical protein
MKAAAAPMVIFASKVCVPRGPKAALETLLEKRAPASALPGCNNTETIITTQARMKSAYKTVVNKMLSSKVVGGQLFVFDKSSQQAQPGTSRKRATGH